MTGNSRFHTGGALTVFVLLTFFGGESGNQDILFAGISSTLGEIKDFISGINSFISNIVSISKLIGFSTFLLFLFILLLSSGLSAIGIPRGRTSFIVSLLIADSIWIMWARSINPGSYDFLTRVGRANLIILLPVILAAFAAWIFPLLFRKLRGKIRLPGFRKGKVYSGRETAKLSEEFSLYSRGFQDSLVNDIISSESKKDIFLSSETVKLSRKLRGLLEEIDED
jgi:hypothetical protein